jgi:RecG-like helicase
MDPALLTSIADAELRTRVVVRGHVRSIRVRPWGDNPTLEVVVFDDTAGITAVFLARRRIAGLDLGCEVTLEGVVSANRNRLTILNPSYQLHVR